MGWQDRPYNRDDNGGIPPIRFSMPAITPLAMWLMIVCGAIYVVQIVTGSGMGGGGPINDWLALTFVGQLGWIQPWRFVTYQYLHGGPLHLLFNMLVVYFFVPTMEQFWGWRKALGFYTIGGVVAGLVFWALAMVFQPKASLIGASGSIFAIMGAVALFFPDRQLVLLFFLVPIRAAVLILGVIFALGAMAYGDLSSAAHLGGLGFGFLAPLIGGPVLRRKMEDLRRRSVQRERNAELHEQQEVDRILAKVAEKGMHSLTSGEKKALDRASQNQRRRDAEREKKVRSSW